MRTWAKTKGMPNGRWIENQVERFVLHAQTNGRKVVNWDAALRNWLLKAVEMGQAGPLFEDDIPRVDSDD